MNPNIVLKQPGLTLEIDYFPAVSIILPLLSVVKPKGKLGYRLQLIVEKIERQLLAIYSKENAVPVITKLKKLICNLNYNTHKKSIVIFVSPVVEQVYYLESEVEEKIAIDEFFEIRDEVFRKKTSNIG